MPSRAELSKIMKSAGYTVPNSVADQMSACVKAVWNGQSTGMTGRQCEESAMGNKHIPGSVGSQFASKWSGSK